MDRKTFVSVICEYNPFHFGHKFQMECFKESFDAVVCIMSGDIVQRGTAAVASKYLRAEAAIKNGANLVLELPIPWCCASARDFARAGVHIANNIGSGFLGFGIEDGLDAVLRIEKLLSEPSFEKDLSKLKEENKNLSYPALLTKFVELRLGEKYAIAVSKPNNILALEYLSAMRGTGIKPFGVERNFDFVSSSSIRSLTDGQKMLSAIPEESKKVFERELSMDFPRDGRKLDAFFIGTLRLMKKIDIEKGFYSVTDDLFYKILSESCRVSTVDELVMHCSNKIYTSARVRRAINSIVFGIEKSIVAAMPSYTTVLAADSIGFDILKNAKKNESFDIITKPAHALECCENTKNMFILSKSIEDIVALSAPNPFPTDKGKMPYIKK